MFENFKIWLMMLKSKKGFYIAPLAMALIVIVVFILIATYNANVKTTTIELINATRR